VGLVVLTLDATTTPGETPLTFARAPREHENSPSLRDARLGLIGSRVLHDLVDLELILLPFFEPVDQVI